MDLKTRLVRLYHVLPSEGRESMERYGWGLAAAIDQHVPEFRAINVTYDASAAAPGVRRFARLIRSYQRYVDFPMYARNGTADVHHIIDHSYGHLVHLLEPRRTVATCHDLIMLKMRDGVVPGTKPSWSRLLLFQLSVSSLRRCRLLLADSHSSMRDFANYLNIDPSRFRVVYLGIDPKFRAPSVAEIGQARQSLGLSASSQELLLNVSTGANYKNTEGSIRTLAQIVAAGRNNVSLLRVGHSLNAAQNALAQSLGVRNRIIDLGKLPEHKIQYAYWVATALLFPSYYEGFGWPVLEAMACGTPVVASDTPTLLEVGGGIPDSLPADDAWGMARAVLRLFNDGALRAQKIEHGHKWAQEFTWERTAIQTSAVYAEVAEAADARTHVRDQ